MIQFIETWKARRAIRKAHKIGMHNGNPLADTNEVSAAAERLVRMGAEGYLQNLRTTADEGRLNAAIERHTRAALTESRPRVVDYIQADLPTDAEMIFTTGMMSAGINAAIEALSDDGAQSGGA